jgi:ribosome-associated protein
MDYEDVVVHIFIEPVRKFYDLEGLWIDVPRVDQEKGVNLGEKSSGSEKRN